MTKVSVDLIDTVTPMIETRVREAARRLPHLRYADIRLEITEAKGAGAENGTPKFSGATTASPSAPACSPASA